MWRYGTWLADAGWHATAVDLRGHGTAPRARLLDRAAYAADLARTVTADDALGSRRPLPGGAAATVASADAPTWTRRLVLIDPAIHLQDHDRALVRVSQETAFADRPKRPSAPSTPRGIPTTSS
jgi:pimeloyl-ACP methyl ester carboxylesterase